ncbi:MAG: M67 family metallopeptidase [Desulfobacula sp.]|nr:M67 family metallopeptidase [Desulfobacula sp.]
MMKIPKDIYEQIILHAQKDLPYEACGYLAGQNDSVTKSYAIKNIDQSHEHFSFDPEEQFAAIKDLRKESLVPIAVYHSHPETPARPSKEDIKLAYDPDISYVIISLAKNIPVIKSFKIKQSPDKNHCVEKEEIVII